MGDELTLLKLIGILAGVASALVAPCIAFFKYNTERIERSQKETVAAIKKSTTEAISLVQHDVKNMQTHIDSRFADIHTNMESRNKEMKDYVHVELEQVRQAQAGQDKEIKALNTTLNERDRNLRQQIHGNEKQLLEFKLHVSENYAQKKKTED